MFSANNPPSCPLLILLIDSQQSSTAQQHQVAQPFSFLMISYRAHALNKSHVFTTIVIVKFEVLQY